MNDNFGCLGVILLIVLMLAIMFGVNSCSYEDWNYGECPKCETRYELRAISKDYLKYYACPDCGKEVKRY